MLTRFRIKSFKSIKEQEVRLPKLTVLIGPNSSGKSNFIEALQCLSRLVTGKTIYDAFQEPTRGDILEYFAFPGGGLEELLKEDKAIFELEADIKSKKDAVNNPDYIYRVQIGVIPQSGRLFVQDEYLQHYTHQGKKVKESGHAPKIKKKDDKFVIRTSGSSARTRYENIEGNKTIASDRLYSGELYRTNDSLRKEISEWRTYYLDPKVSMRISSSPKEVSDIGVMGENLSPFLYRLSKEKTKYFDAVKRKLRSIIPSVNDIKVDLDTFRGVINLSIIQDNIAYSSKVASEGTLRVLSLCAISLNPWSSSLIAFEEPENGVHPRRLELIAELLVSLAIDQDKQVIVTTHSPLFCKLIYHAKEKYPQDVAIRKVIKKDSWTFFEDFDPLPIFRDKSVRDALSSPTEDGIIDELIMRGFLDA